MPSWGIRHTRHTHSSNPCPLKEGNYGGNTKRTINSNVSGPFGGDTTRRPKKQYLQQHILRARTKGKGRRTEAHSENTLQAAAAVCGFVHVACARHHRHYTTNRVVNTWYECLVVRISIWLQSSSTRCAWFFLYSNSWVPSRIHL